jgi:hypothetical protein
MRTRITRFIGAGLGAAVLSGVCASYTLAATPARAPSWEVVAGNYARMTSASAIVLRLTKAGLTGFAVERESRGRGRFQVERPFVTKTTAAAELARVRVLLHQGGIETDTAGTI